MNARNNGTKRRTTILKKHGDSQFAQIPNATLQDSRLSWKSTGLLSYLLSLPHDWEINLKDLANRKRDGRDATRSAVKELEDAGYMRITILRDPLTGRYVDTIWEVSAMPDFVKMKPDPEFPKPVTPAVETSPQESKQVKETPEKENHYNPEAGDGSNCCDDTAFGDVGSHVDLAEEVAGPVSTLPVDVEHLGALGESTIPAGTLRQLIVLVSQTREPQSYIDLVTDALIASGGQQPANPVNWLRAIIARPDGGDLTRAYRFRASIEDRKRLEAEQKVQQQLVSTKSEEQRILEEEQLVRGRRIFEYMRKHPKK